MMTRLNRIRATLAGCMAAAAVVLSACDGGATDGPARDWADIEKRDTLVVLTMFNSTSFFSYRGEAMGFEYELLKQFADSAGVVLQTAVYRDQEELFDRLRRGEGDVVAARVIPAGEPDARIRYTRPVYTTRPVVVQRSAPPSEAGLPESAAERLRFPDGQPARPVQVRARPISSPEELAGATVHVPGESPYGTVLAELSDTIDGDIEVVQLEGDTATESLIRQVARGEIDLAVSHENLAALKQSYFQNITVAPAVGHSHPIVWATRGSSPALQARLDAWITTQEANGTIDRLYKKYFIDRRGYRERVESDYLTSETGRLSAYDSLFRANAPRIGWDWRLLAAQAYQESRFDPTARSWAGAQGLLQIMPGTARDLGVRNLNDPAQSVDGAVRFIEQLDERWAKQVADSAERLKFVLASYNTGPGHVQDAQRLAEKNGRNPLVWNDVAFWLLRKSKRAVYTDPVVRHGFSRGLEPVLYVQKILERFEHYRQFVPATATEAAAG